MKHLLLFALLLPAFAFAQCDTTFKTETDKFTGAVSIDSDLAMLENKDMKFAWKVSVIENKNVKQALQMSFVALNAKGCTDDDAKVTLLLDDNTKMELPNVFRFNCNGIFGVQFNTKGYGSKSYITQAKVLGEHRITAIRLRMTNQVFDYDFTEDQQVELNNVIKCAIAKTGI